MIELKKLFIAQKIINNDIDRKKLYSTFAL